VNEVADAYAKVKQAITARRLDPPCSTGTTPRAS